MSNEDNAQVIAIPRMNTLPKWARWAMWGAIAAITWSYYVNPQVWLVYALAAIAAGGVYMACGLFDGMAHCYNRMHMKRVTGEGTIEELIAKLEGTKSDKTCLSSTDQEDKNDGDSA